MCAVLARDAFIRTNRRAIVTMFICPSACLSDCVTGELVLYCNHVVHISADLSLRFDSTMF